MSEFVTVFEISRLSNGVWSDTVFRLAIGVVALGIGVAWLVRWWRTGRPRAFDGLFPLGIVGWSVLWLVMHDFPAAFGLINGLVGAFETKQYQVVEGDVRVLRQQPAHGHSSGDVVVNGVRFEVNYFRVTLAYRDTTAHGVCAGLPEHGAILRVDIRRPAKHPPRAPAAAGGRDARRCPAARRHRGIRALDRSAPRRSADRRRASGRQGRVREPARREGAVSRRHDHRQVGHARWIRPPRRADAEGAGEVSRGQRLVLRGDLRDTRDAPFRLAFGGPNGQGLCFGCHVQAKDRDFVFSLGDVKR